MEQEAIDKLLYSRNTGHKDNHPDRYIDHYLEQYRIYLHIFNCTSEHRLKFNEFFLGVNTAIMGILGYLESKGTENGPIIFTMVPLVGIAICYCWYKIINSYKQLNRAKFSVIHAVEKKLPLSLFETEWEILGRGQDPKKYQPLSITEKYIPIIFTVLYLIIFLSNLPWYDILKL